ncbi:MAG TPA: GNAT family N-acetyltransferase [Thermomicrobiales bacterium]|nr:GNAT family N-acetyltransferase [Thermomicrobiales bacterium]
MSPKQPGNDHLVFIDPESGFEIRPWPESRDDEAAAILADATFAGTPDAAMQRIQSARAEAPDRVFGGLMGGKLVGAYTLKRDGMANQVDIIAVEKDHRRRGIGRSLLKDALRRSGRRPLVAETDEEGLPFYKACGFKMVGRRKQPDGAFRYRIGWHAPGRSFKGGTSGALNQDAIKDTPSS